MAKEQTVKIIRPGSAVLIGGKRGEEFYGLVNATMISGAQDGGLRTSHQVSWWNGRSHCCEWLEDFEITPVEENATARIGFK